MLKRSLEEDTSPLQSARELAEVTEEYLRILGDELSDMVVKVVMKHSFTKV